MEESLFLEIRAALCARSDEIQAGKMMSAEAITYRGKVFAFFSRSQNMVFKLGKDFDPDSVGYEMQVFNPFKNRPPLNGWFEVAYAEKEQWSVLTEQALIKIQAAL